MHRAPLFLLLIWLLTLCLPAAAGQRGLGIYSDQDLLLPLVNEDRDYTMGLGIEVFEEEDGFYPFEAPLKQVGRWFAIRDADHRVRRSYLLGSVNYTPDDLSAEAPLRDDRPYASVLYLANKRVLADRRQAIGVELQVGLLGTYVAREIQRRLHRAWRDATGDAEPVDPRGWGNQISHGGEPTLRLRVAHSRYLAGQAGRWDLAGTLDLSLGYQTNASAGLALRAGLLGSPFWSLPYDPINRGNFVPAFGDDELYLWGALRGRAVAYDALLQGQFRDSLVTYRGEDLRRLVLDGGVGVTGSWRGVQLTVAANLKTAELARGQGDRTHWWGGIYLTLRR